MNTNFEQIKYKSKGVKNRGVTNRKISNKLEKINQSYNKFFKERVIGIGSIEELGDLMSTGGKFKEIKSTPRLTTRKKPMMKVNKYKLIAENGILKESSA